MYGDERLGTTGKQGPGLCRVSYWQDDIVRDSEAWCRSPGKRSDVLEDLPEAHIVAAQDVTFADLTLMEGANVPVGHVVNVHDIEPRIHVGRHATRRRLNNHAARGGRLDVTGAQRRR